MLHFADEHREGLRETEQNEQWLGVGFSVGSVDSVAIWGGGGRARIIRRWFTPKFSEEPQFWDAVRQSCPLAGSLG